MMEDQALEKAVRVQAKVGAMMWLHGLLVRATDRNEKVNDDACLPNLYIMVACEKKAEIRRASEMVKATSVGYGEAAANRTDADLQEMVYWFAYREALRLPILTIKDAENAMRYPYPLDGVPVDKASTV